MLVLPATPETIAGFIDAADAAPDELSTIANVMTAPPMPFLPPEAARQARDHGDDGLRGRSRPARSARAVPSACRAARRHGAADALSRDLPAGGPGLPADRGPPTMFVDRSTRPWRRRSSNASRPRPRRWRSRSCGCWAARWRASRRTHRVRAPRPKIMVNRRRRCAARPRRRPSTTPGSTRLADVLRKADDGAYVNFLGTRARRGSARPIRETWDRLAEDQGPVRPHEPVPSQPEHPAGHVAEGAMNTAGPPTARRSRSRGRHGPPLIIVGGALSDRRGARTRRDHAARFTVVAYDRRGRGDSGETPPYVVDREIEDLGALSRRSAGRRTVGHSSGAVLAIEAVPPYPGSPSSCCTNHRSSWTTPVRRARRLCGAPRRADRRGPAGEAVDTS